MKEKMMGVSSEVWTQLTTYASSGPAAPPPTQPINLNDSRALVELNFADFHDPGDESDCSAMLQAFLDYAGNLALALKNSTNLDDQNLRSAVRATLPRGNIAVANQIVVPEWVDLNMLGTLVRINGGSLSANRYLPIIVYVPNSIASRVNVYCNPDGVNTGSGICIGKTWSVASLTLSSAGTGYQVGDIITLTQPSKPRYRPAIVTVDSIGPSGSIATFTLTDGGSYSRRPPTGPTVSAEAIHAVAPDVVALVQPAVLTQISTTHADGSPGAGSGAVFIPDWGPDFASGDPAGVYNYQAGLGHGNMLVGQVTVMGAGTEFSPDYGGMFGVMLNMLNANVDSVTVDGGYYGIVAKCIDTRANSLNAVQSMIGMVVAAGSSFECPNVVIDTAFLTSLYIFSTCETVLLRGTLIWPEGNNDFGPGIGPHNSGYAIIVGTDAGETADDIRLDFSMSNCGSATQNGGTGSGALFLSNVQNSHFNIKTSNQLTAIGGTHKLALHTGYGPNVDASSVLVSGTFDGTAGPVIVPGATLVRYFSIISGGTGYAVGDVVAVHSANRIIDAMAQVTAVSGSTVTAVRQIGPGLFGTTPGTAPLATTPVKGSGSGLTLWAEPNASPGMIPGGVSIRDGSMPGWVRDFGICEIFGNDAPTAGTGANKAPRGSKYTNLSTGDLYLNKGTAAEPVWRKVITA
ncbi:hypothetical protein M1D80_07010 (plasmid) [Phyllobacteriaceae bacterium JZ32]